MQISFDPRDLTPAQREHIAGFLCTFPGAPEAAGQVAPPAPAVTFADRLRPDVPAVLVPPAPTLAPEDYPCAGTPSPAELTAQAATDALLSGTADAAAAFGNPEPMPDPTTAFGVPPVPQAPAVVPPVPQPPAVIPSVPPVPQAPAVVPTPEPVNTGTELDSEGLPWDGRIHSSGKKKTADGVWRKKSGVDEALITQVKTELRAVMAAPAPIMPAPVANLAVAEFHAQQSVPVPQPPVIVPPVPQAPAAPSAPPVPQAPQAPTTPPSLPPAATGTDPHAPFIAVVGRTAAAIGAKKITQDEGDAICAKYGVPKLALMMNRPDLLPAVAQEIDALIASRA